MPNKFFSYFCCCMKNENGNKNDNKNLKKKFYTEYTQKSVNDKGNETQKPYESYDCYYDSEKDCYYSNI